ncbi:Prohead protease [uncultured Caudovirales phage]|uniref:Prohead protease n=1 Tax=uncultured Caudovirales phage TaxID=2100421 RepID=A0A6J5SUN1_9CAUD|nr:Prohead protease [uncultured Caudovirales phage]
MKQMEVKTLRAEFKATQNGSKGIVTALVSVFNNIDLGGDRMLPGAFTKTIADWQAKGDPLPAIWSHEWDDPEAHVGFVDPADMKETADGLEVKMQFDLDRPFAEQVFHLLKTRRVTQFSFGYYTTASEPIRDPDGKMVREISSVDLFEVGPTLLGMNPDTQLIEAASLIRGFKAGRVLSGQNEEALKSARDLVDGVLSSMNKESDTVIKSEDRDAQIKAIIGSIEALRERVSDALGDAYPENWCNIRGVMPDSTVVYDCYSESWECETFQQSFTDDGAVVTLAPDRSPVDIMEVVVPEPDPEADLADGKSESDVASRDIGSTITPEQVIDLLTRPKYLED